MFNLVLVFESTNSICAASPLFSVRDVSHRRQPVFAKHTKRVSVKIYDEQLFREVFEEQDFISLKANALYENDEEVPDIAELDVEDALALAKERAKKNAQRGGRPRRRRQQERHKTIGLISKNNSSARAFYVLYISLPCPAKQQREMTKFRFCGEREHTTVNFSFSFLT